MFNDFIFNNMQNLISHLNNELSLASNKTAYLLNLIKIKCFLSNVLRTLNTASACQLP